MKYHDPKAMGSFVTYTFRTERVSTILNCVMMNKGKSTSFLRSANLEDYNYFKIILILLFTRYIFSLFNVNLQILLLLFHIPLHNNLIVLLFFDTPYLYSCGNR